MMVVGPSADRLFTAETGSDSIVVTQYDGTRLGVLRSGLERDAVPQDVIDRAAAQRYSPEVPSLYPHFARLLPDRTGNLWVMAYPRIEAGNSYWHPEWGVSNGADWVVLDPSGRRIAQVRTPPGLRVLEIGDDYVIGVVNEDVNVESIRLYAMHKQT
jgi:hypothetical protein